MIIKDVLENQLTKFILTGVLNTIFGYFIFSLVVYLFEFQCQLAIAISTVAGVLFNYQSFGRLVFNNKESNRLFRFFIVSAFIYFLNIRGVGFFLLYGYNVYISFVLIFIPTTVVNYLMIKYFVFRKLGS